MQPKSVFYLIATSGSGGAETMLISLVKHLPVNTYGVLASLVTHVPIVTTVHGNHR